MEEDEGVPTQDTHRKKINKAASKEDYYAILGTLTLQITACEIVSRLLFAFSRPSGS